MTPHLASVTYALDPERRADLLVRARCATTAASALIPRSRCLVDSSIAARRQSSLARGRRGQIPRDRAPDTSPIEGFRVRGLIEGEPVEARWDPDEFRLGMCHPKVRQRADVVVALGDSFVCPGSGPARLATLEDDPTATLLTVVRAIDHVTTIELDLASAARPLQMHHV